MREGCTLDGVSGLNLLATPKSHFEIKDVECATGAQKACSTPRCVSSGETLGSITFSQGRRFLKETIF